TKNEVLQFEDNHESHVRHTRALWVIVILLVAGLVGLSWYGAPLIKEHQGLLGKMPVLQSTLNNVGTRFMSAEQQISAWANDRAGFSDRLSRIENTVSSNLKTVRNETQLLGQHVKYDMEQGLQAVRNRIAGVESVQREHAEQVALLRNEVAGVR